jgi:hypothetical protein
MIVTERQSPIYLNLALSHATELVSEEYDSIWEDIAGKTCYVYSLCVLTISMIMSIDLKSYMPDNDRRAQLVKLMMERSVRLRQWEAYKDVLSRFYHWDSCEPVWKRFFIEGVRLWVKK